MSKYDDIYEFAVDRNDLITSAEARKLGITNNELVQYAKRGKLERLAQGVYRLSRHVPREADPYALAVARVGEWAYLWGESVIALLGLAPTRPGVMYVATPKRVRRDLPESTVLVKAEPGLPVRHFEDVPCQPVYEAILSARRSMMVERLVQAAKEAHAQGLLTPSKYEALIKELEEGA